jgi:hypothetical protein
MKLICVDNTEKVGQPVDLAQYTVGESYEFADELLAGKLIELGAFAGFTDKAARTRSAPAKTKEARTKSAPTKTKAAKVKKAKK